MFEKIDSTTAKTSTTNKEKKKQPRTDCAHRSKIINRRKTWFWWQLDFKNTLQTKTTQIHREKQKKKIVRKTTNYILTLNQAERRKAETWKANDDDDNF